MKARIAVCAVLVPAALAACGGGRIPGSANSPVVPGAAVQVSGASPAAWATGPCGMATSGATGEAPTIGSAVQPQAAARPGTPAQVFAVWEQDRWNAIGARGMLFSSSTDGGAHWASPSALPFSTCTAAALPGTRYDRISDPSISAGGSVLVATALAFSAGGYEQAGGKSGVLVARSLDGGATWIDAQSLIADAGGTTGPYYFNDRDAVAMDPNGSYVYAVWDRISTNASAGEPAMLARSIDGGHTWSAPTAIFNPGVFSQTFNNQPLVLPDGSVLDVFTVAGGFGASLAAIRSTDRGATWTAPGSTLAGGSVTIASITPTVTSNPIAGGAPIRDSRFMAQTAVDPASGSVAAVWEESSFSSGARNGIAFTVSNDKGATWSNPVQVNGRADVQAFNPSVRFGGSGRLAVTYYDFRDCNSACTTTLNTGIWMRTSADGGRTWSADVRVHGPFDLLLAPPTDLAAGTVGNGLFLGDQQGLVWNGSGWVSVFAASGTSGTHVQAVIAQ